MARIHLSECLDYMRETPYVARWPNANDAICALIKDRLSFDPATGAVYRNGAWISRYSNPSDYTPSDYLTPRECAADHMSGIVANAASRLSRGYSA